MRRLSRIIAGALIWCAAISWCGRLLTEARGGGSSTAARLLEYASRRDATVDVRFAAPALCVVGDDVEVAGQIAGEVEALLDSNGQPLPEVVGRAPAARLRLHDGARRPLRDGATARLLWVPQAAAWVVETLLTEENVLKLGAIWNEAMLENRDEIFVLLTPVVRDLVLDVEKHIEGQLPDFLARHRDEVKAMTEEVKRGIGQEKLAALFEKELWPIAKPRLRPLIEKLSREIWEKLPLWGFTWRLAYQTLPLTDNDHFERAWVRFLESDALPTVLSHSEDLLAAMKEIGTEAFSNAEMTQGLREVFGRLLEEPKFHALSQAFVREVFLDNAAFHEVLWTQWRSPAFHRAVDAASAHVEPVARKMGDVLFGTRNGGITPEFARVLRSQILLKDLQRVVIDPGPEGAPPLGPGAVLDAPVVMEGARR